MQTSQPGDKEKTSNNIRRPGTRPNENVTKCSLQNNPRDWELGELGGWVKGQGDD